MKITIIGTGNVATHVGFRLYQIGETVVQVVGRDARAAAALAGEIGADGCSLFTEISRETDLLLLAVSDKAIGEVARQLVGAGFFKTLMVHCSGATPQLVFEGTGAERYGVFYPLQTFTKNRPVDFAKIPICVSANTPADAAQLMALAKKTGGNAVEMADEQREVLHVAAVFINNFTNHLATISYGLLASQSLAPSLLQPLLEETVAKIATGNPAAMQTGPAIRGDRPTVERHLALLNGHPDWQRVYEAMTASIA